MNILFLTLSAISSLEQRGIYTDLLRYFHRQGHRVTVVSPLERRRKQKTTCLRTEGFTALQVRTLNITKTNLLEKGLATLSIEALYLRAIKKYLAKERFNLVLYSTPPITFAKVVRFIKRRDGAYSYLLLKDIFPQNAVDMGMMKEGGWMYKFFRSKEKELYALSDTIGCMSPANVEFVIKHNAEVNPAKVEVNPNSIEPVVSSYSAEEKRAIRQKYGVPVDKQVLVYGGNLGKPQGLDFLLETIEATPTERAFFLLVGDGTEYPRLRLWFDRVQPTNALLLRALPKREYDQLLAACDIGLLFLDGRFLIPNFPSRLLSYLEMAMPVLAATDVHTDVGDCIEQRKCGYKVVWGNQEQMQAALQKLAVDNINEMGAAGLNWLHAEYTVDISYQLIVDKVKK